MISAFGADVYNITILELIGKCIEENHLRVQQVKKTIGKLSG
jgi:hypothetical protein